MLRMPFMHGLGNSPQVGDGGLQGNSTFGPDHMHAGVQIGKDFGLNVIWVFGEQCFRIVDVTHQGNTALHLLHAFRRTVFGVLVEGGHAGFRNKAHALHGATANMQDQGTGNGLGELNM